MIRLVDAHLGHEVIVGNNLCIKSWKILAIDYVKRKVLFRNTIWFNEKQDMNETDLAYWGYIFK